MKEPNFLAKGKVAHFQEELEKAHEKRRKWAHEIDKITKDLREPSGYRVGVGVLDVKSFDSACEELKRLSAEIEDFRVQLNEAKEML